jgi:hypothetical protein
LKKCTLAAKTSTQLRIGLASKILKTKLSNISTEHPTYFAQIGCGETPGEVQITLEILLPWGAAGECGGCGVIGEGGTVDGKAAALLRYID